MIMTLYTRWGVQGGGFRLRSALYAPHTYAQHAFSARRRGGGGATHSRSFGESRLMRIEHCVIFTSIRIYLPRVARLKNNLQTATNQLCPPSFTTRQVQSAKTGSQRARSLSASWAHPSRGWATLEGRLARRRWAAACRSLGRSAAFVFHPLRSLRVLYEICVCVYIHTCIFWTRARETRYN